MSAIGKTLCTNCQRFSVVENQGLRTWQSDAANKMLRVGRRPVKRKALRCFTGFLIAAGFPVVWLKLDCMTGCSPGLLFGCGLRFSPFSLGCFCQSIGDGWRMQRCALSCWCLISDWWGVVTWDGRPLGNPWMYLLTGAGAGLAWSLRVGSEAGSERPIMTAPS